MSAPAVLMGVNPADLMGVESAVLMGVDIVEADRLARAAERGGEVFARHVTTPAERAFGPGLAAFSVKESLIKAVGVRPPGFTWQDFEAVADAPSGWPSGLLDEAAEELSASTGVSMTGGATYAVRGASARAALQQLRAGAKEAAGAARWGEGGGLFVSLAVVYAVDAAVDAAVEAAVEATVRVEEEGSPS